MNNSNHAYVVRSEDSAVFYHIGAGFSVSEASILDHDEAKELIDKLERSVAGMVIRKWVMVEVY